MADAPDDFTMMTSNRLRESYQFRAVANIQEALDIHARAMDRIVGPGEAGPSLISKKLLKSLKELQNRPKTDPDDVNPMDAANG